MKMIINITGQKDRGGGRRMEWILSMGVRRMGLGEGGGNPAWEADDFRVGHSGK